MTYVIHRSTFWFRN